MTDRDVKVGDLGKELGVTRQIPYRFVGPKGELRYGAKLLERKRSQAHSRSSKETNSRATNRRVFGGAGGSATTRRLWTGR
ncbi:MAG: hypothetical protein WAL59_09590 [Roseiarcus sp.]